MSYRTIVRSLVVVAVSAVAGTSYAQPFNELEFTPHVNNVADETEFDAGGTLKSTGDIEFKNTLGAGRCFHIQLKLLSPTPNPITLRLATVTSYLAVDETSVGNANFNYSAPSPSPEDFYNASARCWSSTDVKGEENTIEIDSDQHTFHLIEEGVGGD